MPVSGYVDRGLSALLCPGAYNAVKTVLNSINNKDLNHFVRLLFPVPMDKLRHFWIWINGYPPPFLPPF